MRKSWRMNDNIRKNKNWNDLFNLNQLFIDLYQQTHYTTYYTLFQVEEITKSHHGPLLEELATSSPTLSPVSFKFL